MRLWMFDRSGAYNSEPFDINIEPERFVIAITGYALMEDAELGLNTFIKRDSTGGHYIDVRGGRISLDHTCIASRKAIACSGTTCYRGKREEPGEEPAGWEYVVKFSWPLPQRQQEGDLLKSVKQKGVEGIAMWVHHEEITIDGNADNIAHLRRGMEFGSPIELSSKPYLVGSSQEVSTTQSLRKPTAADPLARLSGSRKRPRNTSLPSRPRRQRYDASGKDSRSSESQSHVADVKIARDAQELQQDPISYSASHEAKPNSQAGCKSDPFSNPDPLLLSGFPSRPASPRIQFS